MEDKKVLLRRYEDYLNVCGIGVIVLGAWDIVKTIMQVLMGDSGQFDLELEDDEKFIAFWVIALVIVILLALSFLIFKLHLYVGQNASRYAKGMDYKKGYYKVAIVLFVLIALSLTSYVDDLKDIDNIDTTIASLIVDVTTLYVFATVIYTTNKIKKLRAELQEG